MSLGGSRWRSTRTADDIYLADELVLHKNSQVRNNICTVLNMTIVYTIVSKLVDEFGRYSIQHDWKDPISGVHVSPDVRSEITNDHSIAYSFSNIYTKSYQNRLMCVEVSVQRQCRFLDIVYIYIHCIYMWQFYSAEDMHLKKRSKHIRQNKWFVDDKRIEIYAAATAVTLSCHAEV